MNSFFHELLQKEYGALSERIEGGLSARRTTLRVNTLKTNTESVKERLSALGFFYTAAEWYGDALVLESGLERALMQTELYANGEIYLQSLSSMLPPLILEARAGESVLDMTAAPGGKTTQIAALTDGGALITACEKDKIRFDRLAYNVRKQGAPRVTLLHADALKLDEFFRFDKILLDAPCSGSGTLDLRKPAPFSERLVSGSAALQKNLLKKALRLLKKGGTLVYSTCSILKEENEAVLSEVLRGSDAEIENVGIPLNATRLPSENGTLCLCPDENFEGFFIAKIRK